jgi:hypothetical protein
VFSAITINWYILIAIAIYLLCAHTFNTFHKPMVVDPRCQKVDRYHLIMFWTTDFSEFISPIFIVAGHTDLMTTSYNDRVSGLSVVN